MATVRIVLGKVNNASMVPVLMAVPINKVTFTSSGANQATAFAVENNDGDGGRDDVWQITVTGGNVKVAFGPSPDATVDFDHIILDGQTREFSALALQKCAVTDL